MRLVVGNLDCEVEWAGSPALPSHVRRVVARAGLALSRFAGPGHRLWLPAPVHDAAVDVVSGPLAELAPADAILAWGETESVAALRSQAAPAPRTDSWQQALWSVYPSAAIARRANHRRLSFELAARRSWLLPEATWISSIRELEILLARGAHRASRDAQWIVKAPLSAAGRDRLRRRGSDVDSDARIRIERLLSIHGELLFEPWMDRIDDFGLCGFIDRRGPGLFAAHRLVNNPNGGFRSIAALADADAPPELTAAARATARDLTDLGYIGPFGIDAFSYRSAEGPVALQPLSEINARLTFGHLLGPAATAHRPLSFDFTGQPR